MAFQSVSQASNVDQEFFIKAGNIAQVIENLTFQIAAGCNDASEVRLLTGRVEEQIRALGVLFRSASTPMLAPQAA